MRKHNGGSNIRCPAWLLVFVGLPSAVPAAFCDINVGDIFVVSNPNDATRFFLDNFTGLIDGCSTTGGFPVCTDLSISGTLSCSYLAGSSTVNGTAMLEQHRLPQRQNPFRDRAALPGLDEAGNVLMLARLDEVLLCR
jgi:hypothetical protein